MAGPAAGEAGERAAWRARARARARACARARVCVRVRVRVRVCLCCRVLPSHLSCCVKSLKTHLRLKSKKLLLNCTQTVLSLHVVDEDE
eukprot:5059638-Amphidinium_carterae.1